MPLVPMSTVAAAAQRDGTGVGAFNVVQLEHAEAIVTGAEAAGHPVVVQVSQNTAAYHGALAPLVLACLRIAADSSADVVVHLDHVTSPDLVREAVDLGVASVMVDASALPYAENVRFTAGLTDLCHARSVWVEAELGEVGGKPGPDGVPAVPLDAHAPGARTDPSEATAFVTATGVDALAVAVGSSHAMVTRDAVLDLALVSALRDAAGVPLVLHGSSGVPDAGLAAAVRHGVVKVNVATHLNAVLTGEVRARLAADPGMVDPRRYLGPARAAVSSEVSRLLTLLWDR